MTWQRGVPGSMLLVGAAIGIGCNLIFGVQGGVPGSGGAGGAGGRGPGIAVVPMATTLLARTTLTFTAKVPAGGVTWKVLDAAGGSVTPGGAYTAPAEGGVYRLQATSLVTGDDAEASITVVNVATPVTLVSTGELETATGHGSQSHLAYAQGTGEWWLFRDPSAAGVLATSHSKDFVSWEAGEQVTLPQGHSGDGRDLSVAYRSLGQHDVVHVTQGFHSGSVIGRYHVRAAMSAGHAAFGAPQTVNSIDTPDPWGPDGASTVILPSGVVIDTSGYVATPSLSPPGSLSPCGGGDVDVYTSDVADDGAASFAGAQFAGQVLWCVPSTVNARQLLAVGGAAVLLYVDGGSTPPGNVLMDVSQSLGLWTPSEPDMGPDNLPPRVFAADEAFDLDDWTAAVQGSAVHAVRRVGNLFEHRIMSAVGGAWVDGGAIPAQATLQASGLFLAPYGDGLVLVALGENGGDPILYTASDGAMWSAWARLSLAQAQRDYLGGFAPESGPKPALIWTEAAGASYAIAGALLP